MTNRLLRPILSSVLLLSAAFAVTCLQWVVCCSGNCTMALREVWSGMLEHGPARRFTRVHLLLNRASTVLDVESHLPHEGKVVLSVKQTSRFAVRIPRWVDQRRVECATGAKPLAFSWLGNYVMLPEFKRGQSVVIHFPMNETTETVDVDGDGDLDLLGDVEEHYHRGPDGKDVSWFSVVWFENPRK